jgi:hypothetical protein
MPIAPDKPFPKMKGHIVRSKDWNDLIAEVQRLDVAKVNRAGDIVRGPLTVQDAVGPSPVNPAPGTRLHVLETAAPAVLRIQSALSFGPARLEMWSDKPGSPTEWRPGYIQSFDAGDFTGGLSFITNGTGTAQRQGAVEAMRVVNGRVGIGFAASPAARLHVVDNVSPAVLRLQSMLGSGSGRLEMWSDPPGSPNEWRPGYIQSFDAGPAGAFTGGLSFFTNGTGAAQRQGSVEAMRLVNGRMGVGVPAPGYKVDVADRIRLRQGPSGEAGLWLFQTTPNADRAFIGMQNDNLVGLFGAAGANWALNMDVTNGNLGVRASPAAPWALYVNGDEYVNGRLRDGKLRMQAAMPNAISIFSLSDAQAWNNVPNMSLSVVSPGIGAWFHIRFNMNGVQTMGVTQSHAEFRLLIDNGQYDYTLHEFHQSDGWELRGVFLERMIFLAAGAHTVNVQWSVRSPQAKPAVGPVPETRVTLFGCYYGDNRFLTAIEL